MSGIFCSKTAGVEETQVSTNLSLYYTLQFFLSKADLQKTATDQILHHNQSDTGGSSFPLPAYEAILALVTINTFL